MHDSDEAAYRGQYREHCTILNIAPYIQSKDVQQKAGKPSGNNDVGVRRLLQSVRNDSASLDNPADG